jgi:pimeloyl-ACP methyl ester carboxylesterase
MKIVILHGLYMHGVVMLPLGQRLEKLGYKTQVVSYNTLAINEDRLFTEIDEALEEKGNVLLGHSLGGLMIKRYLASRKPSTEKISHVVALSSPIKGASIADKLQSMGFGKMLGNAAEHGLVPHEDHWLFPQHLGCISGTLPVGIRPMLLDKERSDGTVTVEETKITGMAAHVEIKSSHTSIIYSRKTVRQIDYFIQNDVFCFDKY